MQKIRFLIVLFLLSFFAKAQTVYYNASEFPLLGKISDATETRY